MYSKDSFEPYSSDEPCDARSKQEEIVSSVSPPLQLPANRPLLENKLPP